MKVSYLLKQLFSRGGAREAVKAAFCPAEEVKNSDSVVVENSERGDLKREEEEEDVSNINCLRRGGESGSSASRRVRYFYSSTSLPVTDHERRWPVSACRCNCWDQKLLKAQDFREDEGHCAW